MAKETEKSITDWMETPESCRAYYEQHHPAVKEAREKGGATAINSRFGVFWFGDTKALVEMSPLFLNYASNISSGPWPPERVGFDGPDGYFELSLQSLALDGTATYSRVDAENAN